MIHTVNGSLGTLTINPKTGRILHRTAYAEVMRIDLVEYRNTYPESTREDVDILDVGFWGYNGKYTPPCESWRKERDELTNYFPKNNLLGAIPNTVTKINNND